jgi:hypothetical protein
MTVRAHEAGTKGKGTTSVVPTDDWNTAALAAEGKAGVKD